MRTLQLLIVDDEPLIRLGIRKSIASMRGVEVIGECGSGDEAVEAITSRSPDLVLLDVQMPGCTGLDVVRRIGPAHMPPVVFVTAFDEYAVQAFDVNAVDYLLKPFDTERLQRAIERARTRIDALGDRALAERLQSLLAATPVQYPDRLVVREGERFELIPVETIDWIEAANNYVVLHCGAKRHLLGETMTSLETRLDPSRFLRVHRSRMINVSRLVAVHVLMGSTYELELRDGTRLTSGRQYREAVQKLIRG
ncbi:MAG TPA: LytTR family DNA-binding domain-containing protein [Vicinamibacterales bacterium]